MAGITGAKSITENIGGAQADHFAEVIVEEWMWSPGHRVNILNVNHTHLGVGVAEYLHCCDDLYDKYCFTCGSCRRAQNFGSCILHIQLKVVYAFFM